MDALAQYDYCYMIEIPTEMLMYIFKYLHIKQLLKCRQVCKRWNYLIQGLLEDERAWKRYCSLDFPTTYVQAKFKSFPPCEWQEVYKSLSLWRNISRSSEDIDEFCHSSCVADEIRDIVALQNGTVAVHRRTAIVYYNIKSQKLTMSPGLHGDFNKFYENDDVAVSLSSQLHLSIYRRNKDALPNEDHLDLLIVYNNIKNFVCVDSTVFFVTFGNQILSYDIYDECKPKGYYRRQEPGLVSLSIYNNMLHILTIDRRISAFINDGFVTQFNLDAVPNLMNILYQYNYLENMEWRLYFIWLAQLGRKIPEGPYRFLSSAKVYGDTFFFGCHCGVVLVYYKPFVDGELNIYQSAPIKSYNFSERIDIPILSLHPILKMEVIEQRNGHIVLVAMSRKIIMIKYVHDFNKPCKALLPYVSLWPHPC